MPLYAYWNAQIDFLQGPEAEVNPNGRSELVDADADREMDGATTGSSRRDLRETSAVPGTPQRSAAQTQEALPAHT
jgi:hypothetical protein